MESETTAELYIIDEVINSYLFMSVSLLSLTVGNWWKEDWPRFSLPGGADRKVQELPPAGPEGQESQRW